MSTAPNEIHEDTSDEWGRRNFPSLSSYLYWQHWLSLVHAESSASVIEIEEDLSSEKKTAFLESAGLCVRGAVAKSKAGRWWLCWKGSFGQRFKAPGHFVLSRSDPDLDQQSGVLVFTQYVGWGRDDT